MEIRKKDNEIWIGDKHYSFDHNIEKIIIFPQLIILWFWEPGKIHHNNIIAIDYEAKEQWNISDIIKLNCSEVYVAISKETENIFSTISYHGVQFFINVETKQIIKKIITK